MKYLKTYESRLDSIWAYYSEIWKDVLSSEKYILYKVHDSLYFILEINYVGVEDILNNLEYFKNNYTSLPWLPTKRIFIYNRDTNLFKRKDRSEFNLGSDNIEKIIYQSNDLNDIKKICLTLPGQNKFNI